MTRAHLRANWSGIPSLTDHWIGALLRAFAMLVHCAASLVRTCLAVADRRRRMRPSLFSGDLSIEARRAQMECHTDAEPDALPEQESGIILERKEAAASSQSAVQSQRPPPPPPLVVVMVVVVVVATTLPFFPPAESPTGLGSGLDFGLIAIPSGVGVMALFATAIRCILFIVAFATIYRATPIGRWSFQ